MYNQTIAQNGFETVMGQLAENPGLAVVTAGVLCILGCMVLGFCFMKLFGNCQGGEEEDWEANYKESVDDSIEPMESKFTRRDLIGDKKIQEVSEEKKTDVKSERSSTVHMLEFTGEPDYYV